MDGGGHVFEGAQVGLGPTVRTQTVVVGAGLAGALAALVLARRGVGVTVVDLHDQPPPEFRCEKLGADQIRRLDRLGVLDAFAPLLCGRPFTPRAMAERLLSQGVRYASLVACARAAWPQRVRFLRGRAVEVLTQGEDGLSLVRLSSGEDLSGRLLILASGAAGALRQALGVDRGLIRARHSTTIGFDLIPAAGRAAPAARTHPGERAGDGVSYASLFPLDGGLRLNLFTHLEPKDARVRAFRDDPFAALAALMPALARSLRGAAVEGEVEIRACDLHRAEDAAGSGAILIGDAYMTSCPSSGAGVTRILNDIELLAAALPMWLGDPAPLAARVAAFYADPAKRAVDDHALVASERGRRVALATGPRAQLRRAAVRLGARLRRAAAPPPAAPILKGDWVEVRSAAEIAATLDAEGKLDALPFMPEMAAFCGRRLRVHRRADKLCVEGLGLRTFGDALLLETARCDGAAHDGCQRGCLMLWRTAWLRPVDGPAAGPATTPDASPLEALPTRDGELYLCQSTALATATRGPLGRFSLRHLLDDLRRGELDLRGFVALNARGVVNLVRRRLGLAELGQLVGAATKPDRGALDLQPGEWVRIREPKALLPRLDARGRNRGLSFEPEMAGYAGQRHRVEAQITRIVHEETGRMVNLSRTVSLSGLDCRGSCAKNCPRANPLYWREAWLERTDAPDDAAR